MSSMSSMPSNDASFNAAPVGASSPRARPLTRALAVALAAVTAFAALAIGGQLSRADAQLTTEIFVVSDLLVTATNGNAALPDFTGYEDGLIGVSCSGNSPRSGPTIPAAVVTEPLQDRTYLRILGPTQAGRAQSGVTGRVYVNCVFEAEAGAAASMQAQAAEAATAAK